ncbi:lipopolysaccharide assembly protein LapB [Halomonas sp. 1513]|nr:lipopolysaccharide assembly protein LapB [Halomonas sp. 1513]APX93398.1 lipopolysaccharide assembly protein LapB [Halomonas sp. 1513]
MLDPMLLALVLAAVAIGWWLGRRQRAPDDDAPQPSLTRDYFLGLNYLLNEQPDRAIETFVAALEVNSDTIETHIALGNLFRSRGEADRAVKIHQNLLARPTLTAYQGDSVQLELARDFFHLGLLDRAEKLLQGLVHDAHLDEVRRHAKRLLADLLEREKEWQAALDVAQPLIREDNGLRRAAAHWQCELAQQELDSASPSRARKRLKQALKTDPACVRATWMLSRMEHDTGHYKTEIKLLKRIPDQDPDFTPLVLGPLRDAYLRREDPAGLEQTLETLVESTRSTSAIIMLAECLRQRQGNQLAAEFVSQQLQQTPNLRGIDYLVDLYRHQPGLAENQPMALLKQHTQSLLDASPHYRCQRCGFDGRQLHWQCPSCRSWGTTRPITGLRGE